MQVVRGIVHALGVHPIQMFNRPAQLNERYVLIGFYPVEGHLCPIAIPRVISVVLPKDWHLNTPKI
jgi:hypothetical protein